MTRNVTIPNDYLYDVFLSYRSNERILPWVIELEKLLNYWLTQELEGREPRVFFARESIGIGDRWPERIREALRSSRCIVCLWTPDYFRSSWCVSEWRSFLAREEQIGRTSRGLVVPIRCHSGEGFPDEAVSSQALDLSKYLSTLPAFWSTYRAVEMEDRLREIVPSLASVIREAPPFREDWPIVDAECITDPRIPLRKL